jgi:hypothetical protein
MERQQIERLDFADRSRTRYLRSDQEARSYFGAGFYFKFCESCHRMAAAITRTAVDVIRPLDRFGSYATAASFTPKRFVWAGVMAGIAGLATLLLLGWSEIGAGSVSATERRADRSSSLAAAPPVETQAQRMEAIRRRGLELLRAEFPEDEPSPSLARGDRLELHDATIKPVMRVATAGEDVDSVAAPAPFPARPAASKPAEAKVKHAVKERPAHRDHARRASRHHRDRVRMANAKYVHVPREPQMTSADRLQPDGARPEENDAFGWIKRLPDPMAPSSWKDGWDNLWAKGNGGGGASCSPFVNSATVCQRETHVGRQ